MNVCKSPCETALVVENRVLLFSVWCSKSTCFWNLRINKRIAPKFPQK